VATAEAIAIELPTAELASRLRRRKVARGDAMLAEIVLLAAEGVSNPAMAERLGITRVAVATWRRRFAKKRLDGLLENKFRRLMINNIYTTVVVSCAYS
jgi:hypothetical protein